MVVMDKNWLYGTPQKEKEIEDEKTPTSGSLGKSTYNYTPYTSGFKPSKAYTEAMAYTNSLLEQLSTGRTSVSDKLDAIMGKIENRPQFNYDFNNDPLFQNALASAMASGQTAMQDTIGQASALTGGYGSSYATSAANQAYNNMIKGAYDNLPAYYNIARDAYNQEGEELYNQLNMYRAADESEYSRKNNAYNLNYNNAESLYNKENSEYWNTQNYNRQVAESNANLAYKYAALEADKEKYAKESKRADDQFKEEMAYKYATLGVKDSSKSELPSDVQKALINSIQTNGTGANSKLWEYTDILEAQGYSPDAIDAMIAAYDPTLEYSINAYGQYEDQFKNRIESSSGSGRGAYETASFVLVSGKKKKDDSLYYDETTDKTYTYKELKEKGWDKFIK